MISNRVQLFVSAARHLSITQAARQHHITQPAVSRHLRILQQDFGIVFFKRLGRGIVLTDAGRTFLNDLSPILSQLNALQKKYTRTNESLTVACSNGISTHLVPSLMAQLGKKYPLAKLSLHASNSFEVEELLLSSEVDLGVITNPTMLLASFNIEPYRNEPITAFVTIDHPFAQKTIIQPSDIEGVRFVIRIRRGGPSRTESELSNFSNKGIKFKIGLRCDSPESVKEAVRQGAGVGILYHDIIKREIERGEFRPVQIAGFNIMGQSYIVYSKEKPLSSLAREFLALLRSAAAKEFTLVTKTPGVTKGIRTVEPSTHMLRSN